MGLLGGAIGIFAGLGFGGWFGIAMEGDIEGIAVGKLLDPGPLLLALITAPVLTVISGWIPAMIAAQQDPVVVLREK
ncbi:MAG TPA: FtsX-like permease family protein [Sedimentisphaerales bacterium]|nr:FtsX-like permease family protein [Sedimentisphaerales bacterium]